MKEQVNQCLSDWLLEHPCRDQALSQFASRHRSVSERCAQHGETPGAGCVVQSEIRSSRRTQAVNGWTERFDEPANIIRSTQMQRPAHQPGAHDGAFLRKRAIGGGGRHTRAAHAQLMPRRIERLRLQRTHCACNAGWISAHPCLVGEVLRPQPGKP